MVIDDLSTTLLWTTVCIQKIVHGWFTVGLCSNLGNNYLYDFSSISTAIK